MMMATVLIYFLFLVPNTSLLQSAIAFPIRNTIIQKKADCLLSLSSALVDIGESTERDLGALQEWAVACGAQTSSGFQLDRMSDGILKDNNVGAMTTEPIPAGEPVMYVPAEMIFTGAKAREEMGIISQVEDESFAGPMDGRLPHFYLFLKFLKEYAAGDQSPWYPWINSLPRFFTNGSSMTELCTELLPPLVGSLSKKEQIRFRQFVHGLTYVDSHILNQDDISIKVAKWAFAVICTRSFPTGNGDFYIAPMADTLNHATEPEVEIQFDEGGNCYVMASYDIPAGSPLRTLYADPTNPSFLFARYGFVDESSPATFCKIMITDPTSKLVDMGYDPSQMLFYKDSGEVSEQVWDVLLYRLLGNIDKQQQEQFYMAHMNGEYALKQSIHEQYYPQTYEALMSHIDDFLGELDELSILATEFVHSTSNPNPRLPLIYRHNEFVKNTFETVKSTLGGY